MGDNATASWAWHNTVVGQGYQAKGVVRQPGSNPVKTIDVRSLKPITPNPAHVAAPPVISKESANKSDRDDEKKSKKAKRDRDDSRHDRDDHKKKSKKDDKKDDRKDEKKEKKERKEDRKEDRKELRKADKKHKKKHSSKGKDEHNNDSHPNAVKDNFNPLLQYLATCLSNRTRVFSLANE